MKSKPEPGEVSSLNSSTSSKKDDSLKRDRESQELNDSEDEGDLLEDDDEVRRGGGKRSPKHSVLYINGDQMVMNCDWGSFYLKAPTYSWMHFALFIAFFPQLWALVSDYLICTKLV